MASDGTFFGLASLVDLIAQFSYILFLYAFSWLQKILFTLFQQLLFEVKEFVSRFFVYTKISVYFLSDYETGYPMCTACESAH